MAQSPSFQQFASRLTVGCGGSVCSSLANAAQRKGIAGGNYKTDSLELSHYHSVVFLRTPIILLSLFLLLAGIVLEVPVSISASVTPAATPDFAMSASPSNLTITSGSMGFSTVSVTSLNGFAGNVTLSTSAPPVGFGVGISPFILTLIGNGTAQAHVNVNDNFNGTTTWFLNIIGSSGSLSHSTTLQINGEPFIAPTFAISAANPFVVAQGFSNST